MVKKNSILRAICLLKFHFKSEKFKPDVVGWWFSPSGPDPGVLR